MNSCSGIAVPPDHRAPLIDRERLGRPSRLPVERPIVDAAPIVCRAAYPRLTQIPGRRGEVVHE